MTGIDPMFIFSETPVTPMEVAYACVFDPSTAPGGYAFDHLQDRVAERLPSLAPFRRRLMSVPMGLDNPRWVDDPDFELANHLRRGGFPAQGGEVRLSDLAAEVMGRPLDPGQPPWEMHVIEGLPNGRIGVIAKVHHSLIDGVSGTQMLAQLLDVSPDGPAANLECAPWHPPAPPSPMQLLTDALPSFLTTPLRAARAGREVGRTSLRLLRHAAYAGISGLSIPLGAPAEFATPMKASRQVSFAAVPLDDVLRLKEHLGVTINDIVLAVCSGALRTYLSTHDRATAVPMVAVVPVSVRGQSESDAMGNRLSAMFVPLATDQDRPLDRLSAVVGASASAKRQEREVGYSALMSAVSDALPPAITRPAIRLGARLGAVRRLRPGNLVVSNVPGPTFPLYLAGMRMESVFPIGPIVDGVALNITVQSYLNTLFVGLNACPVVVPDLDALAGSFVRELDHLTRAATDQGRLPAVPLEDAPTRPPRPAPRSVPRQAAPTPHAVTSSLNLRSRRERLARARVPVAANSAAPRPLAFGVPCLGVDDNEGW
jgi:WS/DGAT/MGAT family acyltransferase